MDLAMLRSQYRDAVLALMSRYGAENVRVFGSVARGEARPESDVDFLVSYRPGVSLMQAATLWRELKDLLGCEVDLLSERTIPVEAKQIAREAIPL